MHTIEGLQLSYAAITLLLINIYTANELGEQ